MGSTRLPNKMCMNLSGKPLLQHLVDRVIQSNLFCDIIIATSLSEENFPIIEIAKKNKIKYFQGDENDVLSRYNNILQITKMDNFVRFCGDNPLTDMETTKKLIDLHLDEMSDYTYVKNLNLQLGLVEVFSRYAIEKLHFEIDADDLVRRESVGIFIKENKSKFKISTLCADPVLHMAPFRLTVDYEEDFHLLSSLFHILYKNEPLAYKDVIDYLIKNPELSKINCDMKQKQNNVYWESLDNS